MTPPRPHMVDFHVLSKVLGVSERIVQKTWENYPKVFVAEGRNLKSARFIIEDVLAFLADRDYSQAEKDAIQRQKTRLGRPGQESCERAGACSVDGASILEASRRGILSLQKVKEGIQDQNGSCRLGEESLGEDRTDPGIPAEEEDPFNLLESINPISQTS